MNTDKCKSDLNEHSQLECGDGNKIVTNLNVSSSDENTNCRTEKFLIDRLLKSSTKDRFDDESKDLNRIDFCDESDVCDCSGDAKFKKVQESSKIVNFDSIMENKSCDCLKNRMWKRRNLFSLSNHVERNDNFEISHLKTENSTLDNSMSSNENKEQSLLIRIRNYLAEYQESRGTSREEYTYSTLIRIMGQAIGHCLLTLFYVLLNIVPILEIILHIIRFIFDKIIDIKKTSDFQRVLFKVIIFFLEVLSIYICLIFIFGFIISPVIRMSFGIFSKIMLYD
ncbi:PREDICTED: uncharacterized protein LOC105362750 [Ceratosolen solmsi marchali]|uniref:Uncharacterized protein LOC105362750 n=1 Tax=Ceratosolen solmsi marchali TaxID=326594 RepID=A0AAJ7DW27_9HYME|nr:PREDICTED: uncharacterized protein LOC105362750 [Ceratosolen solmsi marchali]